MDRLVVRRVDQYSAVTDDTKRSIADPRQQIFRCALKGFAVRFAVCAEDLREHGLPPSVDHRQDIFFRGRRQLCMLGQRPKTVDTDAGNAKRERKPARGRKATADSGEGARPGRNANGGNVAEIPLRGRERTHYGGQQHFRLPPFHSGLVNGKGPTVIDHGNGAVLRRRINAQSQHRFTIMSLISLSGLHPAIELALVYGTRDNIAGQAIYRQPAAYLHADAVTCLRAAASFASRLGYGLRIYDAYRPPEAQHALWRACPDARYVADPATGSDHSRGVAIDLTLTRAGTALDLGTAFDEMTETSHLTAQDVPDEALRHRVTLCGIMAAAGFYPNPYEWWHFQLPAAKDYQIIGDGQAAPPML